MDVLADLRLCCSHMTKTDFLMMCPTNSLRNNISIRRGICSHPGHPRLRLHSRRKLSLKIHENTAVNFR